MTDFAFAILGLVMLVLAGDALVRGAVNVSLRVGIPALIVSLTIVAIGTSAPELLVAISAVLEGAPGIALGNVVGSNTANVLLVLGVPALIFGFQNRGTASRASYLQMIFGTALFVVIASFGQINWLTGSMLLLTFCAFMAHAIHAARCHRRDERAAREAAAEVDDIEGADLGMSWPRIMVYLALGLIGLPLGADLLVDSASNIARRYDVSETVIGLTLVAVGTSLPELATTVSAAYRRQAEVALGNVIGSNMANVLGIIGVGALFGSIPVPREILFWDVPLMVLSSLALALFIFAGVNLGRVWGLIFTSAYLAYILSLLV